MMKRSNKPAPLDHLVLAADLAYPIILCPAGRIMNGMHRVVKASVAGLSLNVLVYATSNQEYTSSTNAPSLLPAVCEVSGTRLIISLAKYVSTSSNNTP